MIEIFFFFEVTAFSHRIWAAYFFNPRREVLNEQLAQVVEGLEFAGLEDTQMERRLRRRLWTLWCNREVIKKEGEQRDTAGDDVSEESEVDTERCVEYSRQSPPDPSSPV